MHDKGQKDNLSSDPLFSDDSDDNQKEKEYVKENKFILIWG